MIAPIGAYGFKAAIWYQGRSDIYFSNRYQATMAAMMGDWRNRLSADLPFVIVQIPNYGPRARPRRLNRSGRRSARRSAVPRRPMRRPPISSRSISATPTNLHPSNKQEIGRRLAIAARHVVYGDATPPAGAVPGAVRRTADGVVIPFSQITGDARGL